MGTCWGASPKGDGGAEAATGAINVADRPENSSGGENSPGDWQQEHGPAQSPWLASWSVWPQQPWALVDSWCPISEYRDAPKHGGAETNHATAIARATKLARTREGSRFVEWVAREERAVGIDMRGIVKTGTQASQIRIFSW